MGNVKQEQSFKVVLYYDKPGGFMFLSRLIIEFRLPPKGGMTLVRVFSNWEQFPESDGSWGLSASSTPSSQWNWSFTSEGVGVHLADYPTVNPPLVIVHVSHWPFSVCTRQERQGYAGKTSDLQISVAYKNAVLCSKLALIWDLGF